MTKLTAFVLDGHRLDIRPAPLERRWMEETDRRFAYRCLPLNIANGHGWEIMCASGFSAQWNGFADKSAIRITPELGTVSPAISHFGHGVLTFHVPCLFRTEPGFDLYVTGPINRPKDGIAALTGIVETDWAPYTFTMNWLFTRPDAKVRFQKGEPFCHLFPIERGRLEAVSPELRVLSEDPSLEHEHKTWSASRLAFNADLEKPDSDSAREEWQRNYFRGLDPTGAPADAQGHRVKIRLRPFKSRSP
jgi:Family of unknown function (DUF6065)